MIEINKLCIGDTVYNPDVTENSPNNIGKITMIANGAISGEYKRFAKVKFRDYSQFFNVTILVPALSD